MMSATPIFEQLCRDYFDAGKAQPLGVMQPPIARQPTVPAHSIEAAGRSLVYERGRHLPHAFEWAYPGD